MESSAKKERSVYEQEVADTLQKLRMQAPPFEEAQYFIQTVRDTFDIEKAAARKPQVIVLGSSVPEELIYAAGARPHWILGGSLGTVGWADDMVPRDTDPVSRSMLGFLQNDVFSLPMDALIIIPTVNDSARKLAYLLTRAGRRVHTVDLPPVKDGIGPERWSRQLEDLAETLSAHTRKRITRKSLRWASGIVTDARLQMQRLIQNAQDKPDSMSGAFRMFLLYSYYCNHNIEEWTAHLARLNNRLECFPKRAVTCATRNILMMGSPVYFPNYKIPFLLQDVGLNIHEQMDYTTQKIQLASGLHNIIPTEFSVVADAFYRQDCSGAYPQNNALLDGVQRLLDRTRRIDGVVYHVLKGQIEYDFELERLEELFGGYGIPVFRLETDYQYQDVEQLRIRMEAFTEMLSQKRVQKDRYAV